MWKCWDESTFDTEFFWREWNFFHQEPIENQFQMTGWKSESQPTKSETKQTWIKNFFYEGPIKWYILLDDILMKKSKYAPDETRLYINGQENFLNVW